MAVLVVDRRRSRSSMLGVTTGFQAGPRRSVVMPWVEVTKTRVVAVHELVVSPADTNLTNDGSTRRSTDTRASPHATCPALVLVQALVQVQVEVQVIVHTAGGGTVGGLAIGDHRRRYHSPTTLPTRIQAHGINGIVQTDRGATQSHLWRLRKAVREEERRRGGHRTRSCGMPCAVWDTCTSAWLSVVPSTRSMAQPQLTSLLPVALQVLQGVGPTRGPRAPQERHANPGLVARV